MDLFGRIPIRIVPPVSMNYGRVTSSGEQICCTCSDQYRFASYRSFFWTIVLYLLSASKGNKVFILLPCNYYGLALGKFLFFIFAYEGTVKKEKKVFLSLEHEEIMFQKVSPYVKQKRLGCYWVLCFSCVVLIFLK